MNPLGHHCVGQTLAEHCLPPEPASLHGHQQDRKGASPHLTWWPRCEPDDAVSGASGPHRTLETAGVWVSPAEN